MNQDPPVLRSFLSWPPPGLESIQGALLPAAGVIGGGGVLLVLPLLVAIGSEPGFLSPGPFGTLWWLLGTSSVLGIIFLLEGFHRLFRILRTGNLAVRAGHGWMTVLQTATDGARDTGFLLQGARHFTGTEPDERAALLRLRLYGTAAYGTAALWLLLGFVLGIMLSARGLLGPRGLWLLTLLPVVLLILAGLVLRLTALSRSRAAEKLARARAERELTDLVGEWKTLADEVTGDGWLGRGPRHRLLHLRIAGAAAVVLGALILLPLVLFALMGTTVPMVLQETLPRFQGIQEKADLVEPMRRYRLSTDPAITPLEAGEALQALNYANTLGPPAVLERDPVRRYGTEWTFGRRSHQSNRLPSELLERLTASLTPEERSLLEQTAANPAHREFEILARAGAADFTGGLWQIPFPDTLYGADLPIPRFQGVSDAARSHIALAAWELHRGRPAAAETRIREVVSTGFLMMDEHPELIGNLIGIVLVGIGQDGLEKFYRRIGRSEEADRIVAGRERVEEMQHSARRPSRRDGDIEETLSATTRVILDRGSLRGLRWSLFQTSNTIVPFVNLNNAVFGPGEDYDYWVERVEQELVRYPGEAERFRFARLGMLVSPQAAAHPDLTSRLLGLVFGRSGSAATFLETVRQLR
jgi:hypothetical protein